MAADETPPIVSVLHNIEHYIQSLLADPNYDPPVSTIHHLEKLLSMCKIADITLAPPTDPTYVISIAIACIDNVRAYGLCAGPIGKELLRTSRVLPNNIGSDYHAFLCAVYDSLQMLKLYQGQRVYIRSVYSSTWKSAPENAVNMVLQEIETLKLSNNSIRFSTWPPRTTEALKQAEALANASLGIGIK